MVAKHRIIQGTFLSFIYTRVDILDEPEPEESTGSESYTAPLDLLALGDKALGETVCADSLHDLNHLKSVCADRLHDLNHLKSVCADGLHDLNQTDSKAMGDGTDGTDGSDGDGTGEALGEHDLNHTDGTYSSDSGELLQQCIGHTEKASWFVDSGSQTEFESRAVAVQCSKSASAIGTQTDDTPEKTVATSETQTDPLEATNARERRRQARLAVSTPAAAAG